MTPFLLVHPWLPLRVMPEPHFAREHDLFYVCSTCEETLELVKDIFASAGERDIYTGDFVDIYIIQRTGTRYEQFPLKKD